MYYLNNYIYKQLNKQKPSKTTLLLIMILSFISLTFYQECEMEQENQNQAGLDTTKNGENPENGFLAKTKQVLSSTPAKVIYATAGIVALITSVVIAIKAGVTAGILALFGGGCLVTYFSLRRLEFKVITAQSEPAQTVASNG